MADDFIANPGAGGDTFAADDVGGVKYPRMKLTLGADGLTLGDVCSTNPMPVAGAVTNAVLTDVWNAITHVLGVQNDVLTNAYDAVNQRIVVDASQVAIESNLSSVGSTKVIGTVNLTSGSLQLGSVALTSGSLTLGTVGLTSGSLTLGAVIQASGGSSATPWWTELVGGSSANIVGSVALVSGSTAAVIGAVAVSSGVVLGAGSTTNSIGSVALVAGTSANLIGGVVINSGTTAITLGSAALLAGSSANMLGSVIVGSASNLNLAIGSSATYQFMQSIPFSSGNVARTTVNTTVDISIIAANASRKALTIANLSTSQTVAIGLTTAAVTTALSNTHLFLGPATQISFGLGSGQFPLYLGPIRGINITSTTVAGGVGVCEFT